MRKIMLVSLLFMCVLAVNGQKSTDQQSSNEPSANTVNTMALAANASSSSFSKAQSIDTEKHGFAYEEDFKDAFSASPQAMDKYWEGVHQMMADQSNEAIKSFTEACKIDSTFAMAAFYATLLTNNPEHNKESVRWAKMAYDNKDTLPKDLQDWISLWRGLLITKDCNEIQQCCDAMLTSDRKSRIFLDDLGENLCAIEQYEKAVKAFSKLEALCIELKSDWKNSGYYENYGSACHAMGMHEKEAEVFKKGLIASPDDMSLLWDQTRCALINGNDEAVNNLLNKMQKISRDKGYTVYTPEFTKGIIYAMENEGTKAEESLRKALQNDPDNKDIMGTLAWCLAKFNVNLDEAEQLLAKSQPKETDNLGSSYVKGLISMNRGNLEEALATLQQVKDKSSIWNYKICSTITKIESSLANQNAK